MGGGWGRGQAGIPTHRCYVPCVLFVIDVVDMFLVVNGVCVGHCWVFCSKYAFVSALGSRALTHNELRVISRLTRV